MYVVLVAHDFAPSQGLSKLKDALESNGHTVTSFLGFGKNITAPENTLAEHVRNADILVAGMSSSAELAVEEIHAAKIARDANILFGFYSDIYGNFNRPWLRSLNAKTNFLFVINAQDAAEAKKSYGNQTCIVATGNPMWEDFTHPAHSRILTRKLLGITSQQPVILVPGTKEFAININLFSAVTEAIARLGKKIEIYFSLHPGDQNDQKKYTNLTKDTILTHFLSHRAWSGSDLIPAADLVVASASTIGIEAAHQRIPVINFYTNLSRKRLQEATGSSTWKPDELGASVMIYEDTAQLAREITWLLTSKGADQMRKKQERIYPFNKQRGEATRKMMHELLAIVQKTAR